MYASIVLVALVAPPALQEVQQSEGLAWQPTYTAARELGRKQHKPVAVVIGSGAQGWEKLNPLAQSDLPPPASIRFAAQSCKGREIYNSLSYPGCLSLLVFARDSGT